MRPLERIPLHDHSDRNSGGLVDGGTIVHAVGGTTTPPAVPMIEDLNTTETDTGKELQPDGGNGVTWGESRHLRRLGGQWGKLEVVASSGSALTIDLSTANFYDITLTANCTITLSAGSPSGDVGLWWLILRQGGVGGYTVTWPASVKWQAADGTNAGSAPTLFTAVGALDVITLTSEDGGTTYGGARESGGSAVGALDDLSDVTITTPAENDTLRYIGGEWVNDNRRWEPVTTNPGTGPELVWDGDSLVMNWTAY